MQLYRVRGGLRIHGATNTFSTLKEDCIEGGATIGISEVFLGLFGNPLDPPFRNLASWDTHPSDRRSRSTFLGLVTGSFADNEASF